MAQGINIQAADGKYANLNFEVGASGDVSATIPKEGGELATKEYVDSEVGVPNSPLVKTALNASGDAPIYACRAWVNFNGTGTVAIRASGNVSSITDNGVGDYTVNFTTTMPDANFTSALSMQDENNTNVECTYHKSYVMNANNIRLFCRGSTNLIAGVLSLIGVSIFR